MGLETAGTHLAEHYGPAFQTIWAIGLLASGQVATIGLTYAGQLVMTGLLDIKVGAGACRAGRCVLRMGACQHACMHACTCEACSRPLAWATKGAGVVLKG